jgi:hypothetical protein
MKRDDVWDCGTLTFAFDIPIQRFSRKSDIVHRYLVCMTEVIVSMNCGGQCRQIHNKKQVFHGGGIENVW